MLTTELTNDVGGVFALLEALHEVEGTRVADTSEIGYHLLLCHSDTSILGRKKTLACKKKQSQTVLIKDKNDTKQAKGKEANLNNEQALLEISSNVDLKRSVRLQNGLSSEVHVSDLLQSI